jgi:hypothetical protein
MRKNVLALSIAAMIGGLGFAGAASADVVAGTGPLSATVMSATNATALEFAEGGVGHMLLVPYFNAQNGNMTVLHVVNTDTVNGKAMKVRFRGASNSDDILDFQVFMSPGDVWTAAVTTSAGGGAQIVTGDNTCTLPKLSPGVQQAFVQDRLNSALTADQKNNNTREGYVEIFNMADIPPLAGAATLFTAIKHVNGVAPCTDAVLNATLVNITTEAAARSAGFDTPTTGLMGDWYIINVPQTTTFSGASTAVVATLGGVAARGNFVHFPQNANNAPSIDNYSADPLFRTINGGATGVSGHLGSLPKIQAANYDLPDMSTPYVFGLPAAAAGPLEQAGRLTNALAVRAVTNEYATDPGITAKTDWVFSMPTRRYSVAYDYSAANAAANARLFSTLTLANVAQSWFTSGNTSVASGQICVNADSQIFYSREEQSVTAGAVFSPGAVSVTRFCGETSVLAFADTGTSVLGASVARQTLTSGIFVNGWGNVNTNNSGFGLPILGASFIKLSNPQASAGVSGNYGITWPHRFTR